MTALHRSGPGYYQTKQYGDAVKCSADSSKPAKRRAEARSGPLTLLQGAYANAGNEQGAQTTLEKLVRHYPEPKTWLILCTTSRRKTRSPQSCTRTA